jgi:deoxyribodipyrimidine photo-lyase
MTASLLWFRHDLRLGDHPALVAAMADGAPVLPVFVLDDEAAGVHRYGGAARWWLRRSLTALARALADRGAPLFLARVRSRGRDRRATCPCGPRDRTLGAGAVAPRA